ncbi:hypothetical protein IUS99_23390 [Mycobacteroides abscessus subsp. massiliense]|uniref:hypothetical protein n=1 Tax=Mycobacteroides abscessus TaxID=36809 RepID=UPI0012FFDC29|nr:hypothetical protein [Mycobacteroides abscessus]MBN7319710.1 hypothetical protein [Mycobacteroides abscessus subsp. massiliense]
MPRHAPVFPIARQQPFAQVNPQILFFCQSKTPGQKWPETRQNMSETDEKPPIPKHPPGLRSRGKRLWQELHTTGDFRGCPETALVAEEACYLADEVARQRRLIRRAGTDTRTKGYNGQMVSIPEIADLQRNQQLLLSMLKSLRMPENEAGKLTPSQIGSLGAQARWKRGGNG